MRGPFPWQQQSCQDQPRATSRGRRGLWARPSLGEGFPGLCQVLWGPWLTCRWSSPAHTPGAAQLRLCPALLGPRTRVLPPHWPLCPPCLPPSLSHLTQLRQASGPAWPWPPPRVTCPDLLGRLLSKPDIACPAWPPTGAPTPARSMAARDLGPLLPRGSSPDVFLCVRFSLRILFTFPSGLCPVGVGTSRGVHPVALCTAPCLAQRSL